MTTSDHHFCAARIAASLRALARTGLAFSLLGTSALSAATITVDTNSDSGTHGGACQLREAIEAANTDSPVAGCSEGMGRDLIVFAPNVTGVFLESDLPAIIDDLDIQGRGLWMPVIDGDDNHSIFDFVDVEGSIKNLTLAQGEGDLLACIRTNSVLIIEDSFIEACTRTGSGGGGGLSALDADVTIRRTTFSGNRAAHSGAIYSGRSLLVVEDSLFAGNRTTDPVGSGGAIAVGDASGDATIRRTTFWGNIAARAGGAIGLLSPSASLTLEHVTVSQNTSRSFNNNGGAVYVDGPATFLNTLIAANVDLSNADLPDVFLGTRGNITSFGNNLIGSNSGASVDFPPGLPNVDDDYVGSSVTTIDPLLGGLATNGGPTDTLLPAAGSLAIDKGTCPNETTDQRGFLNSTTGLRIVDDLAINNDNDGCDIGAVEVGAVSPFVIFNDGFESGNVAAWQ